MTAPIALLLFCALFALSCSVNASNKHRCPTGMQLFCLQLALASVLLMFLRKLLAFVSILSLQSSHPFLILFLVLQHKHQMIPSFLFPSQPLRGAVCVLIRFLPLLQSLFYRTPLLVSCYCYLDLFCVLCCNLQLVDKQVFCKVSSLTVSHICWSIKMMEWALNCAFFWPE